MGTAERRLEILKYLCKHRKATMPQLAEKFGVSVRTIQRDISELEVTLHIPLNIRSGKYNGGVYINGDYSFDRMSMHKEESTLLIKIQDLVRNQISDKENLLFSQIIKKYSKTA